LVATAWSAPGVDGVYYAAGLKDATYNLVPLKIPKIQSLRLKV
jgi:hypothetical protein